ncbi:ABC transporter ATP-binding protein [Arenibaculum sp.]|jgi:ATP-binding cassette subfamily C protein|uniref:ABC transporter ATP-binding protein n=1 Tax=Arenibaculum sp. TaxID=2865862 RepID=UPI002E0FDE3D|nr:ABC transporter ATP-binding protein [Arenibaculum sp.]
MLPQLKKLVALLDRRARRNGIILLLMMIAGAGMEVVGVAAVPAYVSMVVYPEQLARFPLLQSTVERLGLTDTNSLVVWGAVALIAVFAIKNSFLVFNYYLQTRYTTNRRIELAGRLTRAYMRAPYTFHVARNTSELLRNIDREASVISYQVLGAILELLTHVLILAAVLIFLFLAEPWITFWWMVVFGLMGGAGVAAVSAKLKRYGLEEQEQRKHFVQSLYQGFGSIKEARVLNREGFFAGKVAGTVSRIARVVRFKNFTTKAIAPVTEFIAITGLLVIAAVLVLLGRPTESILVTLSLFVVGLVRLRQTIGAAMTHLAGLRYSIVSVDPVHADLGVLEAEGAPRPGPAGTPPRHMRKALELRDVWYRHEQAGTHALKGIDLVIPAGSAVGLVGSTGAGKSTLVDVVLGLLQPERGSVLVDGVDIREGGVGAWQRTIGYVPQSIYLLDDTIRRNVALGLEDAEIDEEALWTAIRTAQLEGFVKAQPEGLDAVIGEQGVRLSGGERQRIGIARALYHDPDVLILDEATSSLDNATERAIIGAVETLKGRRTVIMIAHRLTTVQNCDALHFLKAGRIEASGSYSELQALHQDFRLMSSG